MQRSIGKDGVQDLREREPAAVGHDKTQAGITVPRLIDHRLRKVQSGNFRSRESDLVAQVPGSTSQIENALSCLRREQIDHFAPVLPHKGVLAVVEGRIPSFVASHEVTRWPVYPLD